MTGAVPGIGAVGGITGEGPEKRRRQGIQIDLGLTDDVAGHKLRGVLKHMDKSMQLLEHVVGDVPRGAGLAVEEDGDVLVAPPDLAHEHAQLLDGLVFQVFIGKLVVIDGENKAGGPVLLLGNHGGITETGDPEGFHPFKLNGIGQGPNPGTGHVFGTKIFVDDDDWKAKFHCFILRMERMNI